MFLNAKRSANSNKKTTLTFFSFNWNFSRWHAWCDDHSSGLSTKIAVPWGPSQTSGSTPLETITGCTSGFRGGGGLPEKKDRRRTFVNDVSCKPSKERLNTSNTCPSNVSLKLRSLSLVVIACVHTRRPNLKHVGQRRQSVRCLWLLQSVCTMWPNMKASESTDHNDKLLMTTIAAAMI